MALNQYLISQKVSQLNCDVINHFGYEHAMAFLSKEPSENMDSVVLEAFSAQFKGL